MGKIINVKGRQVFDSRGNPTVEAEIFLSNGISASSISPSGASTGAFEAYELRDGNEKSFLGKSVTKAVNNINTKIASSIKNQNPDDQLKIDNILLNLDGSKNKSVLGANAILAVSLATAKAAALSKKFHYIKTLVKVFHFQYP